MDDMEKFHNRNPASEVSKDEAIGILERGEIGFLAMAYESRSYCVPVNYVYDEGDIYIHSALEGKKMSFIEVNPLVCLTVTGDVEYIKGECNYAFESVVVHGKAWVIEDVEQKRKAYDALIDRYEPDREYSVKDVCIAGSAIIVIEIDEITGKKKAK